MEMKGNTVFADAMTGQVENLKQLVKELISEYSLIT